LNRNRIIALLEKNFAMIEEDLALLDSGTIRISIFGVDVTHDHYARLKAIGVRNREAVQLLQK
jgi:hypothetical protein